ncbi:MAG TPA: PaaX family transcriptional regulator C-terminal domain-containing protein [Tichowtungia sp.]|nr:PaaX family transcriptional regulator C-terminal domain-containing protein [Tichowtungia sp.]
MKWKTLHHPDISLPIIKRKAGQELITLLAGTAGLLLSGGKSVIYSKCYPNNQAFLASLKRLRKQGLVTVTKQNGSMPEIKLSPSAITGLPPYYTPEKFWSKRWNKWWYILIFDVPEKDRSYRDTLRRFLKQLRCGCLQRSVWVTPADIRPDYDDLNRAAAIESVAFLFESKTVLGFGDQSVVREAWDFDQIGRIQDLYIQTAEENLARLKNTNPSDEEVLELLRTDNQAYTQAMLLDPLLPRELHPEGYNGEAVFKAHSTLCQKAVKQFK